MFRISEMDLVVFDFDGTVVSGHVTSGPVAAMSQSKNPQTEHSSIYPSLFSLAMMIALRSNNVAFGIASYGLLPLILEVLDIAFSGADRRKEIIPDHAVITPNALQITGWSDGSDTGKLDDRVNHGKFQMVDKLVHTLKGLGAQIGADPRKKLLIDDNYMNCWAAAAPQHGYSSLWLRPTDYHAGFSHIVLSSKATPDKSAELLQSVAVVRNLKLLDSLFSDCEPAYGRGSMWRRSPIRSARIAVFDGSCIVNSSTQVVDRDAVAIMAALLVDATEVFVLPYRDIALKEQIKAAMTEINPLFSDRVQVVMDSVATLQDSTHHNWLSTYISFIRTTRAQNKTADAREIVYFGTVEQSCQALALDGFVTMFFSPSVGIAPLSKDALSPLGQIRGTVESVDYRGGKNYVADYLKGYAFTTVWPGKYGYWKWRLV